MLTQRNSAQKIYFIYICKEVVHKNFLSNFYFYICRECCYNLDFYKKMVAFVMAYSFTEPPANEFDDSPPPMMVPMADILNHVAKNNARLSYETEALKMVATKPIKKVILIFK